MASPAPPPPFPTVQASAPGKVILAGEHAVVHGTRALATVINLRTSSTLRFNSARPDAVQLLFHHRPHPRAALLSIPFEWPLADLQAIAAQHLPSIFPSTRGVSDPDRAALDASHAAFASLLAASPSGHSAFDRSRLVFLLYFCFLFKAQAAVVCELTSELPVSAGLGSSASFCASLAAAFYPLTFPAPLPLPLSAAALTTINVWAFEGERILHGSPSGVDNTAVVLGGVIQYRRGPPVTVHQLPHLGPMRWLIVDTRQARDTKELVAGVGRRLTADPARVQPLIDRIDALVGRLIDWIAPGGERDLTAELAPVLEELQGLLRGLGVSHERVEAVVKVARGFGCAAKLTGGGGGGCVLCLLRQGMEEGEVERMKAEMEAEGFECLQAEVGHGGVECHLLPEP